MTTQEATNQRITEEEAGLNHEDAGQIISMRPTTEEPINITGFKSVNAVDVSRFLNVKNYTKNQNGYNNCIAKLESLVSNRKMEREEKKALGKAFPAMLTAISTHFSLPTNLKSFVAEYMATIHAMTADEREKNPLQGNETNYLFKLLEDEGNYPAQFNIETGNFRFPNQWYSAFIIISNNIEILEAVRRFK